MRAAAHIPDGGDLLGGLLFALVVIAAVRVAWWFAANFLSTDGYWAYEIDTEDGRLLYVGSTDEPGRRMHGHENYQRHLPDGHPRKWWFDAEAKVRENYWPTRATWYRSKRIAQEVERRAIREKRPIANQIRYKGIPTVGGE